jgi:hypothetical protein
VLEAPGSNVVIDRVDEIRIYSANGTGQQIGSQANTWTKAIGGGPVVDGQPLDFAATSVNWSACGRDNTWTGTTPPESLGVHISYRYEYVTPLAQIMSFFGPGGTPTLQIDDRTVMALNPTND